MPGVVPAREDRVLGGLNLGLRGRLKAFLLNQACVYAPDLIGNRRSPYFGIRLRLIPHINKA